MSVGLMLAAPARRFLISIPARVYFPPCPAFGLTVCADMRVVLFCLLLFVAPALAAPEHPVVAVCFTPGADCDSRLIELIDNAQKTVRVAAYTLTSEPIADALIRARQRNVKVWVVLDRNQRRARKAQGAACGNMASGCGMTVSINSCTTSSW